MYYYYLYKTTCIINDKVYIGVHKTKKIEDGYIGNGIKSEKYARYLKTKYDKSGIAIPAFLSAVLKYGYYNFKREILEFFDSYEAALLKEKQIVTRDFIDSGKTYNVNIGGVGHEHTLKQREKISQRMRENNPMKNPEIAKKVHANRTYNVNEETKKILSDKGKLRCADKQVLKRLSDNGKLPKNKTIYEFEHVSGVRFIGMILDLRQKYNLSASNSYSIITHPGKIRYGWKLNQMKKTYLIDEQELDKIKVLLQQKRYGAEKKVQKDIDDLFLYFNYLKEAPKECKCP